ncbi:hypothetical protein ACIHCQ_34845 [Streptomyces sp. NPDC052236]|uniref:hypothetical protein n=1 Tax=Streptomyces sp. NPDC052236 TaxID=3365686 RepID=UPI0037D7EBB6
MLEFTGGNPLALSLAAAVAVQDNGKHPHEQADWSPSQDVISTLLSQLVGDPPTSAHRTALQVCGRAYITSEALLRSVVGGERAGELFDWLRAQPFIESTAAGLFPHDVVREALEADLRWRDPEGFGALHKKMHQHLLEGVRQAPPSRVLQAVGALQYLYRTEGLWTAAEVMSGGDFW